MRDGLLLCELHAHTTWSDGQLTLSELSELVDLYGRSGFDVLCVTDHAVRLDDPAPRAVDSWTWPAYTAAVRAEAERALAEYDLHVIQGLELSDITRIRISPHTHSLSVSIATSPSTRASWQRSRPRTARARLSPRPTHIPTPTRLRSGRRGESGASARSSGT